MKTFGGILLGVFVVFIATGSLYISGPTKFALIFIYTPLWLYALLKLDQLYFKKQWSKSVRVLLFGLPALCLFLS